MRVSHLPDIAADIERDRCAPLTPDERRALTRIRRFLDGLDRDEVLALMYARSLRSTIRSHAQKKRLTRFNLDLREALTGHPVK